MTAIQEKLQFLNQKGIGMMMKKIATGLILFSLISLSIYVLWGWLTIQDIRSYCAKEKIDPEMVLDYLATGTHQLEYMKVDPNGVRMRWAPDKIDIPISRFNISMILIDATGKKMKVTEVMFLSPFVSVSENTNNLFCCFGIGYMTGILVVGIEFLKKKKALLSRLIFRPLLGALASCILLIVILSGGSVIWNEVAGMNGLSLGMIGVVGCLFCEKVKILTASF